MSTSRTKPSNRNALVTVGYMRLLLSSTDAIKMVGLLQKSVVAKDHFDPKSMRHHVLWEGEMPTVELELLQPGQLVAKPAQPKTDSLEDSLAGEGQPS